MLLVSREKLEANLCRESFYDFVQRFWETCIPETPVWNWHIPYLCDEFQKVAELVFANKPKEYDVTVNISPGTTKSTIASVMFPAWCWTRQPSLRSICGSYAYDLSLDLSRRSRQVIQSDKFKKIFPEIQLEEDQNTKGYFINTQGGARRAVTVGGAVTGTHGHIIIVDDPVNPKGAQSETILAASNLWMQETLSTRKINKEQTPTILIQQRLHENDATGSLLKRTSGHGVKHICLPGEETDWINPPELRAHYVDGLMDVVRLSRPVLQSLEKDLGEYGYACQILQRPIPRGGGLFKTARLQLDVPHAKFTKKVRYWDKAGTRGGGARTAGVLLGMDVDGFVWILDVVKGQWDAYEREAIIKATAQRDGLKVEIGVEQEPGSGGKESAENTVRNLHGFRVRVDRPTGDKYLRADPFAVQVNGGNVRYVAGEWNQEYLNELEYFPRGTYKDQVDATSGAYAILNRRTYTVGGF